MPLILAQGNVAVSDVICRRITFIGDNSEQISAFAGGDPFSPRRILLPQVNEPLTPTLSFGNGQSGFYQSVDDLIDVTINQIKRFEFTASGFRGFNSNSFILVSEASSDSNPTLIPNRNDLDTGIGRRTTDIGVLIAGGQNCMEFGESSSAPLVGFYGTAAIALQTGVAVSAAGVHAALVALGLITA